MLMVNNCKEEWTDDVFECKTVTENDLQNISACAVNEDGASRGNGLIYLFQ